MYVNICKYMQKEALKAVFFNLLYLWTCTPPVYTNLGCYQDTRTVFFNLSIPVTRLVLVCGSMKNTNVRYMVYLYLGKKKSRKGFNTEFEIHVIPAQCGFLSKATLGLEAPKHHQVELWKSSSTTRVLVELCVTVPELQCIVLPGIEWLSLEWPLTSKALLHNLTPIKKKNPPKITTTTFHTSFSYSFLSLLGTTSH